MDRVLDVFNLQAVIAGVTVTGGFDQHQRLAKASKMPTKLEKLTPVAISL